MASMDDGLRMIPPHVCHEITPVKSNLDDRNTHFSRTWPVSEPNAARWLHQEIGSKRRRSDKVGLKSAISWLSDLGENRIAAEGKWSMLSP